MDESSSHDALFFKCFIFVSNCAFCTKYHIYFQIFNFSVVQIEILCIHSLFHCWILLTSKNTIWWELNNLPFLYISINDFIINIVLMEMESPCECFGSPLQNWCMMNMAEKQYDSNIIALDASCKYTLTISCTPYEELN